VGARAAVATSVLVLRVGSRLAALPLRDVAETMRPLPLQPVAGAPASVMGLAVIRGSAVPVLDVRLLLGLPAAPPGRFVTTRVGERCVALAVDAVLGTREVPAGALEGLPPLLGEAHSDLVAAIGALDGELLLVLQAGRRLIEPVDRARAAAGPAL
jgi:purine-binding chemotaxis protein CheW